MRYRGAGITTMQIGSIEIYVRRRRWDSADVMYERGYREGFADGDLAAFDRFSAEFYESQIAARIVAFGAIRRAAKVARELDAIADAWWDDPDDFTDPVWLEGQSLAIRMAIRAAIRSPKA